ncbi:MAG: cyclodeaminase/cyclohydrolase family protein [Candidatus Bipolaricaulia bacterium]
MTEKTLDAFLEELSSAEPTPGGGAAAALVGSLAASLVAMVAGLTIGKRGYEGVESTMREVRAEAVELRDRLAELVELDIAAFDRVMAAYKLPKDDPARRQRVEEALQGACEIPREVAERSLRVLGLSKTVAEHGKGSAASDAGAAATLAAAGLEVALLNVAINLQSLEDGRFKREYGKIREELAAAGARLKGEALGLVRGRIRG